MQSLTSSATASVLSHNWNLRAFGDDPITQRDIVLADTSRLRRELAQSLQQARELSAQSRSLKLWWQLYRENRARTRKAPTNTISEGPVVATARRVPWRRLQMEDMEGGVIEWTAPEYTQAP